MEEYTTSINDQCYGFNFKTVVNQLLSLIGVEDVRIFCPNTGQEIVGVEKLMYISLTADGKLEIEKCPHCGEEHLFNFLDKNQQFNVEIINNQVVVETITTNEWF